MMQAHVFRFYNRLQYVLDSVSPNIPKEDNLMTICRTIAGHAYVYAGYEDDPEETPDLITLAAAVFKICSNFKRVSFQIIKKLKPSAMADLVF